MKISDSIEIALKIIKAKKLKTFLNVLGIIIGVSSVITIMCIGGGGEKAVINQLDRFGINTISIKAVAGGNSKIRMNDYMLLKNSMSDILMTPVYMNYASITSNKSNRGVVVWGVDKGFENIFPVKMLTGRSFTSSEADRKKTVCVIENSVAKKLYNVNAIGKVIELSTSKNKFSLTIIGVIEDSSASFGDAFGDNIPTFVYLPVQTCLEQFSTNDLDYISLKPANKKEANELAIKSVKILERRSGTTGEYYAEDLTRQRDMLSGIIDIITWIIGAVASVSLIVGGLGIMNIMLVSVSERTNDIGMMKAVGAKNKDIMMQFLVEAMIITLVGAIVGGITGVSLGYLITKLANIPFVIDLNSMFLVILFVVGIGLLFGVYPAKVASKLDPVDALR